MARETGERAIKSLIEADRPVLEPPEWAEFLRPQAHGILALDLFTADLLNGTKVYVLAVTGHGRRRVRVLGATGTRSSPRSSSRPGTCSWTWRMPGHEPNSSCMTGTPASRRRSMPRSRRPGCGSSVPPFRRAGHGGTGPESPAGSSAAASGGPSSPERLRPPRTRNRTVLSQARVRPQ